MGIWCRSGGQGADAWCSRWGRVTRKVQRKKGGHLHNVRSRVPVALPGAAHGCVAPAGVRPAGCTDPTHLEVVQPYFKS